VKQKFITIVSSVLILLTGLMAPVQASGLTDQDKASIQAEGQAWVEAFKARDWDTISELYAEDAVLLPANAPMLVGRDAIKEDYAALPPMTDQIVEQLEIDGQDDLAFVLGILSFSILIEGQGPVRVKGKYLEIWKKYPDGRWKIIRDIWNTDHPIPAPSPEERDSLKVDTPSLHTVVIGGEDLTVEPQEQKQ
jgi:ketosteroid isomerase-like protein